MTEELDIAAIIQSQAWSTQRRFSGYVEVEDLVQEAWVYVLDHEDKINAYKDQENSKFAAHSLGQDIWKCLDRYARKERAQKIGFEPADEAFYGDTLLTAILPAVLLNEPEPPQGTGERTASVNDPAEGGTWMAMFIDVKTAWEKADLTTQQRTLLSSYFKDEKTQSEIAEDLDISQQGVGKQLKRAKAKLTDQLGGAQASDCPNDCVCHEAKLRRRPGTLH